LDIVVKNLLKGAGVLVALAGLFIVGAVLIVSLSVDSGEYKKRDFERSSWLNGTKESQGIFPRLGMADSLIASNTLHGMSKKKVLDLLGKPDMEKVRWNEENISLIYWLGPERGFMSVDSEWLAIRIDKKGKVYKYSIVRD